MTLERIGLLRLVLSGFPQVIHRLTFKDYIVFKASSARLDQPK
jgi:hypothetical protein